MFISLLRKGKDFMNHNMRKMYSELEVIELVKQAISSGEISGGTKLYKHVIEFEVSGSPREIIVINKNNEAYDFANLYGDLGDGSYISIICGQNGATLIYSGNDSFLYQITSGVLSSYYDFTESPDEDTFTDTVTPL